MTRFLAYLLGLLDLSVPQHCAGCAAAGHACCGRCRAEFGGPLPVRRAAMATGPPAYALAEYRGAPRHLVLAYKERGRHELAPVLGAMLAGVLPWLPGARPAGDGTWHVVPAPSRPAAIRRRGGEHMARLARCCAADLARQGLPAAVAPALRLAAGVRDSVGLTAHQRAVNLAGRVRPRRAGLPAPGTPVVLIDDVVTTGATAAACTRALADAGLVVTAVLALTRAGA
ncbi:ComF family protein [Goodfellowiella coeruleoviolacea]|uniref:Amidophosphoribosyltransferases n=1 Tax=Goodfellowiella coeruleoviolacea TaxID=334858 RepID=A0AAE3GGS7_9PSEU|nr:ComF family protein [Goodfellowiella coeruleoviolacea]MCP2167966.1 putative amidophosphoribosyltransferases [Goodfellowiella coeruleoviolacea]